MAKLTETQKKVIAKMAIEDNSRLPVKIFYVYLFFNTFLVLRTKKIKDSDFSFLGCLSAQATTKPLTADYFLKQLQTF